MKPPGTTRRQFLRSGAKASAALSLASVLPGGALGRDKPPPSEKITLGVIGIGPRCTYDLQAMLGFPDVRCVAIADVQASRRQAGKKLVDGHYGNSDCRLYRDFRELLGRKDIDAVLIATGDRWHARASILAAKAGKDVYSEKPCGITIAACQELADTMRRQKRVFQAGTQRRSVPNFQRAVALAHSGKLGKLRTLHASVYVPVLDNTWLAAQKAPPRDVTDWDLWLGPAAWRPFNQAYVDGRWRGQWDFDSGARLLAAARLGRPHGRPVPVGQQGGRHDAGRVRALGQEHRLPLRQRGAARTRLPQGAVQGPLAPVHLAAGHLPGAVRRR